jgi:Dolichyl-phosphate-mannose-protein mannosyltransferase
VPSRWDQGAVLIAAVAAAKFLLQMFAARNYGYFRDELYFFDLGRHLSWGYLDLPPLVAAISAFVRVTLGTSLTALRLLPALSGVAKVVLAGLMARELGGQRFAQGLAALAVAAAPGFLGADHLLTMNTFEGIFWTGCAYALIRIIKTGSPRAWVWFGVLAGLGLENKYSMFFFGLGLVVGLLLTSERRLFWNRWFWLAALIAFAIFLPNLLWQVHHDFVSFVWLRYHRVASDNVPLTPLEFMAEQLLELGPLAAPIWLAGLWFYFGTREGKPYRVLGWAYLVILAILLASGGRVYYLFPAYPMLFGSGAVVIERMFRQSRRAWLKPAYVALLLLSAAFLAPFALPVLRVEAYMRYAKVLDLDPPDIEQRKLGRLPQLYSDMFGWREMTTAVARAYQDLPPQQRTETAIFANDYGQAGALAFFGTESGLPHAISPHQAYFYWGPGDYSGESVLMLGPNPRLESECTGRKQVGIVHHDYSMPYENFPIILCTGLKQPLKDVWPDLKKWE